MAAANDPEELVRANLPLVNYAVVELRARVPAHVRRDDLVSAAMYGLAQAARTFDPTRGVAFDRYASRRIKGALLDELRACDWATRSVRGRARQVRDVTEQLAASLGRNPTTAEIAEVMGVAPADVHAMVADTHRATILNYDSVFVDGGFDEILAPDDEGPEEAILRRERHAYLVDAVAALPDRLRRVVVGYFFEERPMEELAKELGVSESRISQLRAEAIERLRDGMNSQLEPEVLDLSPKPDGVVARRRAAYYAAIAEASDYRSRLSADAQRTSEKLAFGTAGATRTA